MEKTEDLGLTYLCSDSYSLKNCRICIIAHSVEVKTVHPGENHFI